MSHPVLGAGKVAVVTGGASGIGFAAARRFAAFGMRVAIADLPGERLAQAEAALREIAPDGAVDIRAVPTDVSRLEDIERLEASVREAFGPVSLVMNNAGVPGGSKVFGPLDVWEKVLSVNLMGVIHGSRVFAPAMIASGAPGVIINTGSKQGITTPPGDPAYNVSKAGVKVFTEALQHELRNTTDCRVNAHLLIPGFVFTPLAAGGRTEKPAGAWTPDQTIDFMIEKLVAGDFYILCPDNDVPRSLDEKRIAWAAGDIIENRQPLSRWHKDYADAFADYLKQP